MAFPMPLVVPKTRTTLGGKGGTSVSRFTLVRELQAQSNADLHSMLVGITREDTAQQIRLGNPPHIVTVDNMTNKPLEQVERKVVVLFGSALAKAAMGMVERELRQAIGRSTYTRSGRLSNLSNWQWRYVKNGGVTTVVTSANPPASLSQGDFLVLTPVNVRYASAANKRVAKSGRLNSVVTKFSRKFPPKSTQNMGFLAATTNALRRRSEFALLSVSVVHTQKFAVAGEVRKYGTGVIVIRPRFKQMKV
jgi:hypothetical protein